MISASFSFFLLEKFQSIMYFIHLLFNQRQYFLKFHLVTLLSSFLFRRPPQPHLTLFVLIYYCIFSRHVLFSIQTDKLLLILIFVSIKCQIFSEFTTMAGRRLRAAIKTVLTNSSSGEFDDNVHIVIAGLTNSYSQYVTTLEEYEIQRYEVCVALLIVFTNSEMS